MKRINGRFYDTHQLTIDEIFDLLLLLAEGEKDIVEHEVNHSLHIAEYLMTFRGTTYFLYYEIGNRTPSLVERVGDEKNPPMLSAFLLKTLYKDYRVVSL